MDNSLDSLNIDKNLRRRMDISVKDVDRNAKRKYEKRMQKKRIYQLYLNGLTPYEVHRETGFNLTTCKRVIKSIDKDIAEIDKHSLFQLIKSKVIQMMDNHNMISSELIKEFIRVTEDDRQSVNTSIRDGDSTEMLRIAREISRNNKDFSSMLSSMGVTAVKDQLLTLPPPKGSTDNKILEIEYEVADVKDDVGIRDELRKSLGRMGDYLDEIDKIDKSDNIKSITVKETE